MDVREKLIYLILDAKRSDPEKGSFTAYLADYLINNGVTCISSCHKARSAISKTGLMCTTCHSDIDRDAEFCKYCGAKVFHEPPKGE